MRRSLVLLAAFGVLAAPARAEPGQESAGYGAGIAALQTLDQRVADIGWRLKRGNAPFCDLASPTIGLRLHDMRGYTDPAATRARFGLEGDLAVLAAAAGSPARSAGLSANTEIRAVGDLVLARLPAKDRLDWQRLAQIDASIAAALAANGAVDLVLGSGERLRVEGVPACPGHFEIDTSGDSARADGRRVVIGLRFPPLGYETELLAAALAHELAHNLLGHNAWLDRAGRRQRNVRLAEREADRLMPWLLVNAGYPPDAAASLLKRWGPDHGGGIFRKRTHAGWDERVGIVEAELAELARHRSGEGGADWSRHFRRDITPDQPPPRPR